MWGTSIRYFHQEPILVGTNWGSISVTWGWDRDTEFNRCLGIGTYILYLMPPSIKAQEAPLYYMLCVLRLLVFPPYWIWWRQGPSMMCLIAHHCLLRIWCGIISERKCFRVSGSRISICDEIFIVPIIGKYLSYAFIRFEKNMAHISS